MHVYREDEHQLISQYCHTLNGETPSHSVSIMTHTLFSCIDMINSRIWMVDNLLELCSVNIVYCLSQLRSPMQLLMTVDVEQRAELETLIRDLEDENRLV